MKRDKPSLIERRENLAQAISLLQKEYENLNREIREIEFKSNTTLDSTFFHETVEPLLSISKDDGKTGMELQKELNNLGFKFSSGGFRTFLTRSKDRGLLEMKKRPKGSALWFLKNADNDGNTISSDD